MTSPSRTNMFTGLAAAAVLTASAFAARAVVTDNCQDENAETLTFLTIGDPAPPLDVAHWLRGEEVTMLGNGRVYAIEFWATWCKFCHASLPTLGELQSSLAEEGVTIVAISDERLQKVFGMLSRPEWHGRLDFTIGADPDKSVQRDYMAAAAIGNIPTVFIIGRDGFIEWIGHPRDMEQPLRQVAAGTWDREASKSEFEERIAPARERSRRMKAFREAYRSRDWPELMRLFDEAIEADPHPELRVQKFLLMIGEMNEPDAGYAYGGSLLEELWDDPRNLNVVAWFIVDSESVEVRDLDLAMRAAKRACELTSFEDAQILDTLARVYYEKGDLEAALTWQRKAVERLDDDEPLAEEILSALKRYEGKQRSIPRKEGGKSADDNDHGRTRDGTFSA